MKTKSNQSKIDCLQSNHSYLDYSELDHSQLNHSMMVNTSSIVLGGLMGVTLLSGLVLSSSLASADTDATDEITITVPTSCSMSSTGTNSHTAEIGNGQSNSTIGETTITTNCNDNEGFAIYAIGYTGDTLGNNKLTSTSLGSTHDIVTGTATSGNTSNWAMKLSTITSPAPTYPIIISGTTSDTLKQQGDPDYSTFQQVPDDYTKVAYRTSSTDTGTNAEGSVLKTTYQAYISPTQSAGTYTGKVKYVLVYPHNGDAPTVSVNSINDLTYMQDFATITQEERTAVLASMIEGQQYQLADSRDSKSYYISRLADGNVWMTQNLDHDIVIDGSVTYNSTTTDLPANTTWMPVASTRTANDTEWNAYNEEDNPNGGDYSHAESYDPGDLYWNGLTDQNAYSESCNDECDENLNPEIPASAGNAHYHLGNYYNWTAAVAMNDSNDIAGDDSPAEQSICPAGWTLPRAGLGENSFHVLFNEYGLSGSSFFDANGNDLFDTNEDALWVSPLYFTLGGNWNGNMYVVGEWGSLWSSVQYSDSDAYFIDYSSYGFVDSDGYYDTGESRSVGYSVRCVARPVSSTLIWY